MNEAAWDARVTAAKIIGVDYIGSGGLADRRASTATTARCAAPRRSTASARTSVEAGVGPVYIHNHTDEFDSKYVDNGVLKTPATS